MLLDTESSWFAQMEQAVGNSLHDVPLSIDVIAIWLWASAENVKRIHLQAEMFTGKCGDFCEWVKNLNG